MSFTSMGWVTSLGSVTRLGSAEHSGLQYAVGDLQSAQSHAGDSEIVETSAKLGYSTFALLSNLALSPQSRDASSMGSRCPVFGSTLFLSL